MKKVLHNKKKHLVQDREQLLLNNIQGVPKVSGRFFKNGCGIQMSQATPTKFSMLFKHNYGKLF